jgi:hypothetical protein
VLQEAASPGSDGVTVAAEFGGDLAVGRLVRFGDAEDEAAAESQGLRRGGGTVEDL